MAKLSGEQSTNTQSYSDTVNKIPKSTQTPPSDDDKNIYIPKSTTENMITKTKQKLISVSGSSETIHRRDIIVGREAKRI